jgi:hypothetical protein
MGWTLLGFHSIYVNSGIEYPVSIVVPFYYYFKLLVLGATFVLPSLTLLNPLKRWSGEGSVSNPLVVGWFHFLIVPGVQKMHALMDHDPKRWALEQLSILPFLLLDLLILPGVLLSDEERESVRIRRNESYDEVEDTEMEYVPAPSAPPASLFQRDDIFPIKSSDGKAMDTDSDDDNDKCASDSGLNPYNNLSGQSAMHKSNLYLSPTRLDKIASHRPTSLFPRTTPTRGTDSTNLHMSSPVAKSRVASSTLRLRRFSREHEVSQILSPSMKLTPRIDEPAGMFNDNDNNTNEQTKDVAADKKETKQTQLHNLSQDENESPNHNVETIKPRRSRRERLSLGDHFRELVTGDANIRVRDHLFDLELPSVPICPSPRHVSPPSYRVASSGYEGRRAGRDRMGEVDTSNITTRSRRSSRLANRPDYTKY